MKNGKLLVAVLIADLMWSVLAMGVAFVLRYGTRWSNLDKDSAWHLLPFLAASCLLWGLFSLLLPLDGFRGSGWRLSAVVSQLLLAVGGLMLILLSGGYLLRSYVSRLALFHFGLLLFAGFLLLRLVIYLLLRAQFKNGAVRQVVILGGGRLAQELGRKIQRHPEMLCRVVGFLAPDDGSADSRPAVPLSHSTGALGIVDLLLAQQRVDEVILVLQECASPDLLNLVALFRKRGIEVSLVPQFCDLYLSRPHLSDLGGIPILRLARPGFESPVLVGKRAFDLVVGGLLFLVSFPVLLPLAIVLRAFTGKAFRWETRCGWQGKPFAMLRLNVDRTADNKSRFEAFLNDSSLIELPQLWNVLRGEMSLVGPRPESRDRVRHYSEWQQQRLTVKPGMTGLAQVQGLREQHSSEEKTRFDLQYLLDCSLWTDLSLLLQTVGTLLMRSIRRRDSLASIGSAQAPSETAESQIRSQILENAHRP